MAIALKIPEVGESITEVEIGDWLKKEGEEIARDEGVVTLESEKATVELPAPESGTLSKILKNKGSVAKVGEVIGYLEKSGDEKGAHGVTRPTAEGVRPPQKKEAPPQPRPAPKAESTTETPRVMPSAQRELAEH